MWKSRKIIIKIYPSTPRNTGIAYSRTKNPTGTKINRINLTILFFRYCISIVPELISCLISLLLLNNFFKDFMILTKQILFANTLHKKCIDWLNHIVFYNKYNEFYPGIHSLNRDLQRIEHRSNGCRLSLNSSDTSELLISGGIAGFFQYFDYKYAEISLIFSNYWDYVVSSQLRDSLDAADLHGFCFIV